MKDYYEILLSGSGGQGLILAAIILAEAAVREGKNVVQTQSYGPEARGGASKAEVIISGEDIDYPRVSRPDLILVMNETAFQKYAKDLSPQTLLVADTTYVDAAVEGLSVPFSRIAREEIGKEQVANIIALGFINRIADLVGDDTLEKAVLRRVPRGTEGINLKALECGRREAARLQAAGKVG